MGSGQDQHGCNTGLSLDLLGFTTKKQQHDPKPALKLDHHHHHQQQQVYPALSLGPTDQGFSVSPGSSSYSNNTYSNSMKRSLDQEKENLGGAQLGDEVEVDKAASFRASDEEDDEASPRKKLRLTKDQSAVLEDSFKEHSTLNPHQKQALAKRLNLRPRQVEVWFQNRRARTKLKQTEMDCEVLKKCCGTLTEENKRLQKEVQELKSLKLAASGSHVLMHVPPPPTLSMCPSCERFVSTTASSPPVPLGSASGSVPATSAFPNVNGATNPSARVLHTPFCRLLS